MCNSGNYKIPEGKKILRQQPDEDTVVGWSSLALQPHRISKEERRRSSDQSWSGHHLIYDNLDLKMSDKIIGNTFWPHRVTKLFPSNVSLDLKMTNTIGDTFYSRQITTIFNRTTHSDTLREITLRTKLGTNFVQLCILHQGSLISLHLITHSGLGRLNKIRLPHPPLSVRSLWFLCIPLAQPLLLRSSSFVLVIPFVAFLSFLVPSFQLRSLRRSLLQPFELGLLHHLPHVSLPLL